MAVEYVYIRDSYGGNILAPKVDEDSGMFLIKGSSQSNLILNRDGVFGGVFDVGSEQDDITISITKYLYGQTVNISISRDSEHKSSHLKVTLTVTNSSLYQGGTYVYTESGGNYIINSTVGKFFLMWTYEPSAGTFDGVEYGNACFCIFPFFGSENFAYCLDGETLISNSTFPAGTTLEQCFEKLFEKTLYDASYIGAVKAVSGVSGLTITLSTASTNSFYWRASSLQSVSSGKRYGPFRIRVPESEIRPYDPSKNISDATLNLAPTKFYYDGNEHTPAASLVDRNGYLLKNGVDYTVSYSADNINVGEKIALAIGIGEYIGEVQANWWILADNDISAFTMVIVPRQFEFDGESHEPLVTLYDNSGNLLTPNIDYAITFGPDTVTVGEKYVRCEGIGNYTGTIQGTWSIVDNINDPYSPGGTTVPSTGPTDGTWELPDDELAIPGSLFNDLATQLYRPYAMTAAQVASFSNQLWNTDILDIISRYFEKPTEVVISLMSFPFTVECENSVQINFNWISSWSSVYVLGHPITKEIQTLDFGYVDVDRYSGLFYDYQPYSSVQLYLPYIGFVPLKMNEVVGKRISLYYRVDVLSGDFTAVVETGDMVHPEQPERTQPIIGYYQGNIARPMPLSQQDLFSLFKKGTEIAITGAVAATAGTVGAIEGLAAERAVGDAVQFTEQGLPQSAQMAMGRAETSQAQSQSAYKTFKRFGAATVANSMLSIGNASAPILRNGTIDGISGRTSGQEAFIVITVPNQNVPDNQRILGYPTNQPGPLSKFSGYTEVRDIRLKIPNATESEIAEIESIVRGGIVI